MSIILSLHTTSYKWHGISKIDRLLVQEQHRQTAMYKVIRTLILAGTLLVESSVYLPTNSPAWSWPVQIWTCLPCTSGTPRRPSRTSTRALPGNHSNECRQSCGAPSWAACPPWTLWWRSWHGRRETRGHSSPATADERTKVLASIYPPNTSKIEIDRS